MSLIVRKIFLLSIIFFVIKESSAENKNRHAIIFGGGCESTMDKNRFTPIMSKQAKGLIKHGWNVSPLVASNIKEDFAKDSEIDQSKVQAATKETLIKTLDSIIADPNLKDGDMLLVSFNTHGTSKPDGSGHQLCLSSNFDNSENIQMDLDDPDILNRLKILKSKKIKMGFTDMSCYSGASVPILKEFGCVIASQASNLVSKTYGVSGSVAKLLEQSNDNQKKLAIGSSGKLTLEDVYLDALLHGDEYKTMTDYYLDILQPASSLFEENNSSSESVIDLISPMAQNSSACHLQQNSLQQLNQFLSPVMTKANHFILEKLSGRKIPDLELLKKDLQNRINYHVKVKNDFNDLSKEKQSLDIKIDQLGFFSTQIELPKNIKSITEDLIIIFTAANTNYSDIRFSEKNGILDMKISFNNFLSYRKNDLSQINEQAQNIHKLLTERAEISFNEISSNQIPSIQDIKSLLFDIDAKFKNNSNKLLDQALKLQNDRDLLTLKLETMKKENPFLSGYSDTYQGQHLISKDLNLIKANNYLEQRNRWINSQEKPEHFKNCAEFELN